MIHHNAGTDDVNSGGAHKTDKSSDGRLERFPDTFVVEDEVCQECPQKASYYHPDGRDENAGQKADYGSPRGIFAASRELCSV